MDFFHRCEEHNIAPIFLVGGDLQDTVSTTDKDNAGKTRKKQHDKGILKWAMSAKIGMTSLGYDHYTKNELGPYLTRQGYAGARGIDHWLGNSIAEKVVHRVEIDNYGIHIDVNKSDHHFIFCDLLVAFDWKDEKIKDETRLLFGTISGIPVERDEKEGQLVGFVLKTKKIGDDLEKDPRQKLLKEFAKPFDENRKIRELEKNIQTCGNKIESEILRLTKAEAEKGTGGLPERTETMREDINNYFDMLDKSLGVAMSEMGLTSKRSYASAGHDPAKESGKKRKKPPSTDIHKTITIARACLNKTHNLAHKCMDDYKWAINNLDNDEVDIQEHLNNINKSIAWMNKIGNRTMKKGLEALGEVEEELKRRDEEESEHDKGARRSTDTLDGNETNRLGMLGHGLKDEIHILVKMDDMLHEGGGKRRLVSRSKEGNIHLSMHSQDEDETNMGEEQKDGNSWKDHTKIPKDFHEADDREEILQDGMNQIEQTRKKVAALRNKLGKRRHERWLQHTRKNILDNNLKPVTKQMIKKPFEAPEAHPFIFDGEKPQRDENQNIIQRHAVSNREHLKATKQHHSIWTGTAGEERNIYWLEEVKDKNNNAQFELREVDKEMSSSEASKLVRDGGTWMEDHIKTRFIEAHNEKTGHIFDEVPPPNDHFIYPYTVDPKAEVVHFEGMEENFWKGIEKVPGKARHEGMHLAVLARGPMKWARLWLRGLTFVLAMRIAPISIKRLTRCPIPKGADKPGETRPLSLVHDAWAFINSEIYEQLGRSIELAGVLDKDSFAYRRGKGAIDAVIPIVTMLEECYVTGEMVGLLDEDEEKYFDRILHDVQQGTMMAIGMPDQGYREIKEEDMTDRICTVTTNLGNAVIRYLVGAPQGQKMSVLTCNLVTMVKTKQWKTVEGGA
ncbi:hypothetical protein ACHAWF_006126 [Thalassiosira exigua]